MLKTSSRWRAAVALSCLVVLGTVMGLLLGEGAIRFYKRDIAFQPDPELIRSLRPSVSREIYSYETADNLNGLSNATPRVPIYVGMDYTNNLGFRMHEDIRPAAREEKRILLLGDSFVEAETVPDEVRFYRLVDQNLKKGGKSHVRWQVINAAIQNGAPSQYVLQLRRYLPQLRPDAVVVFLAPNDVTDDSLFERRYGFVLDSDGLPIAPKARLRLWLLRELWGLRYFEVVLASRLASWHEYLFSDVSPEITVPDWESMVCASEAQTREVFKAKTGRYLIALRDMARARNVRFGVFLIHYMWYFENEPFAEARHPGLAGKLRRWKCDSENAVAYNNFVEGFLRENAIEYWNPYDAVVRAKAAVPKRKLWNFDDYHFSQEGHRIMAEEVTKFLNRLGVP